MKLFIYAVLIFLFAQINPAQSTLDKLSFLEGSWSAEKWDGTVEIYWSKPEAGNIIGMFRFYIDDELQFTEHILIVEEEEKIVLKLRHFHPDFISWEEKNEYLTFKLLDIKENFVQFKGLSYELTDQQTLNVKLQMNQSGETKTEEFVFKKM